MHFVVDEKDFKAHPVDIINKPFYMMQLNPGQYSTQTQPRQCSSQTQSGSVLNPNSTPVSTQPKLHSGQYSAQTQARSVEECSSTRSPRSICLEPRLFLESLTLNLTHLECSDLDDLGLVGKLRSLLQNPTTCRFIPIGYTLGAGRALGLVGHWNFALHNPNSTPVSTQPKTQAWSSSLNLDRRST